MASLTIERINEIFSKNPSEIEKFFADLNARHTQPNNIIELPTENKMLLGEKISEFLEIPDLAPTLLFTLRICSRDVNGIESLLSTQLCEKLLNFACVLKNGKPFTTVPTLIEAQKSLINTVFHSSKMRSVLKEHNERLIPFLAEFDESRRKTSKFEWIRQLDDKTADEIAFFYHKIAFVATAKCKDIQKSWPHYPGIVDILMVPLERLLHKKTDPTDLQFKIADESLKTFFNIFCREEKDLPAIEKEQASKASRIFRDLILSDSLPEIVVQSAVHCLSVPPLRIDLSIVCGDPKAPPTQKEQEFKNMELTERLLAIIERKCDEIRELGTDPLATESTEMLGPYFQFLSRLCMLNKYSRRYCRLRIIPPLTAEEVQKRPEEQENLRGKLCRMMMTPTATKEVVQAFLFIICKRSTDRFIKYFGFGHAAGHLANLGLLGTINQAKRDSDSEDSETEEYNSIRDTVNPVTGAVYPADRGSILAGMSDEQKEFEAMKLVDAMNKMMEAGIVKPGTIGEDGKVREVKHVLELIDKVQELDDNSDSD
ncbi:unnamed protein product [Caenorhabditis sp. 36 PRJEB53466]|nr:unnamed protein product [Caenorhabditis sp. 36 PRJEB53466]